MKYSDGFFVFQTENTDPLPFTNVPDVVEKWVNHGNIDGFDSYTYYWLIRDQDGFKSEFHEAPVWVNNARNLVIVFLSDYKLISEVIHATSRRFGISLIPYSLAARTTVMNDGNLVVANKGVNDTVNKVKTTLLKSDQQRVSVIESVLVGE
ncbi:hypothetical protein QNK12_06515 [Neobacillus cucumis]|nr:hypothetical protein QNK12_06515 [Neobacillus cucumis]